MANFGLYSVNSTATLPVKKTTWRRSALMLNGTQVGISSEEGDGFGARVVGDSLVIGGEVVAKSASQDAAVTADGQFGEVDLLGHHKCINITLADYNNLLNGGIVTGYKAHDPDAVYNIVDNVATAPTVYCDSPIDLTDPLYNNQPVCALPAHQATQATFTNMSAPHISVHGYKFEITPGERLEVTYMVDTRTGDFINRLTRGETFTTTIKDAYGNVLYDNTTYAGVFKVKLAPFRHNNVNTTGQTWFSVECVDSRGVGSIVLYYDILIRDAVVEKLYQMTVADLATYGITTNDDGNTTLNGYKNKVGFTNLFAAVKSSANNYTGIKLYNPTGDYTYYIDYHKNHSSTPGQYDFGAQTYKIYHIVSHAIVAADEQTITQGGTITIGSDEYTVDTTPFEWVKKDGAHLHRIGGTGSNKNKIRVRWKDDVYGSLDPATQQYAGDGLVADGEMGNGLHVFNTISGNTKSIQALKGELADGYYYVVIDSRGSDFTGDTMVIPSNFTLDMNEATFKGVKCVDLKDFCIIKLVGNEDTHVKNGTLAGIFDPDNDIQMFVDSALTLGTRTIGSQFEKGRNIMMENSKFCSFDGIESYGAMGYEATTTATVNTDFSGIGLNTLGYINENGTVVQPDALAELDAALNPEVGSGGHVNLVYSSGYISCSSSSITNIVPRIGSFELNSGKQHELFLSFYDANKSHLCTVKTAIFNMSKKPSGAAFLRVSAYGVTDSNGELLTDSSSLDTGRKVPFEKLGLSSQNPTIGCSYTNCYWHDTRTIAFNVSYVHGILYENCRYHKIANIQRDGGQWYITHLLGDIEEEWAYIDGLVVRCCTATRDAGDFATRAIKMYGVQSFTFLGNTGFSYEEGAMQSGLIMGNDYCGLKVFRRYRYEHPCILYRNNRIDDAGFRPFESVNTDLSYKTPGYPLRWNRCDDPVCTDVAMRDTMAYVPGSLTGSLTYKYHRTKLNNTTYK